MATKKKKKSPSKGKGKKNAHTYSVKSLKKMLAKKGVKTHHKHSGRNPSVFGVTRPTQIAGMLLGITGGVTIAKLIPPMLPAGWTASDGGRFLTTAGIAFAAGVVAHYTLPAPYRDAVFAGAGSQALSVGLNPLLRKVSSSFPTLGRVRNGVGDFVPANFPEPNNPIYNRMLQAGMATLPGMTSNGGNLGKYRGRYN